MTMLADLQMIQGEEALLHARDQIPLPVLLPQEHYHGSVRQLVDN